MSGGFSAETSAVAIIAETDIQSQRGDTISGLRDQGILQNGEYNCNRSATRIDQKKRVNKKVTR